MNTKIQGRIDCQKYTAGSQTPSEDLSTKDRAELSHANSGSHFTSPQKQHHEEPEVPLPGRFTAGPSTGPAGRVLKLFSVSSSAQLPPGRRTELLAESSDPGAPSAEAGNSSTYDRQRRCGNGAEQPIVNPLRTRINAGSLRGEPLVPEAALSTSTVVNVHR